MKCLIKVFLSDQFFLSLGIVRRLFGRWVFRVVFSFLLFLLSQSSPRGRGRDVGEGCWPAPAQQPALPPRVKG